jgi:hypothetical protein
MSLIANDNHYHLENQHFLWEGYGIAILRKAALSGWASGLEKTPGLLND